jgi:ABC-type Fe3+-hydroxamate transport system substrate-binding protein
MSVERTRRIVVGWSYENARLFVQLREWDFRDTQIVTTEYYSALRAVRNVEVWLIGPEWHFRPQALTDIYDLLNLQGLPYRYGETDWLLGVNRGR